MGVCLSNTYAIFLLVKTGRHAIAPLGISGDGGNAIAPQPKEDVGFRDRASTQPTKLTVTLGSAIVFPC